MRTPIVTDTGRASSQISSGRRQLPDADEEYGVLWAMTCAERIDAMWRGELTRRQLCRWSSRAQHEVPLLGGELAWIVMHTPDWAEITNDAGVHPEEVDP